MNEKDLRVKAERYVELLSSYDNYVKAMEKVLQKIAETRKELLFLEKELEEAGAKIKDVE
jgi:recombinational DNA repair ATPase RecF